jgi:PAS domain S-box-containing protein
MSLLTSMVLNSMCIKSCSVQELTHRKLIKLHGLQARYHLATMIHRPDQTAAPTDTAVALRAPDGRIAAVNSAFARMLGYTTAELCGRTFESITFAPDIDIDSDLADQLFAGAIPAYEIAKRYKHRDGGLVKILLHVSTVSDAAGKILFAVVNARPVLGSVSTLPVYQQDQESTDEVEKIKRAMFW